MGFEDERRLVETLGVLDACLASSATEAPESASKRDLPIVGRREGLAVRTLRDFGATGATVLASGFCCGDACPPLFFQLAEMFMRFSAAILLLLARFCAAKRASLKIKEQSDYNKTPLCG